MKKCTLLVVCGSGTVSSTMVSMKIKEKLEEHNWSANTSECSPAEISGLLSQKTFDAIICVSPVYEEFDVPKVKASGMLSGFGTDKVMEETLEILNKLDR